MNLSFWASKKVQCQTMNWVIQNLKFFRISIDDFLLKDIEAEKITPVVTETAPPETANNNFRELLDVLREKDSTIREMAEEIGMLKQTITQLKQDKSGRVSDASDSTVANAI